MPVRLVSLRTDNGAKLVDCMLEADSLLPIAFVQRGAVARRPLKYHPASHKQQSVKEHGEFLRGGSAVVYNGTGSQTSTDVYGERHESGRRKKKSQTKPDSSMWHATIVTCCCCRGRWKSPIP